MNIRKCNNGHFFDSDKFSECPYCKENSVDYDIPERFSQLGRVTYLGSGSTSQVFKISGDQEYALKIVQCAGNESKYQRALYELRIMERLKGEPRTIQLLDCELIETEGAKTIYMLEEFQNSLSQYLSSKSFCVADLLQLVIDVCDSLLASKSRDILHSDVQPKNIFVDNDSHIKIGDFSHSLFINDTKKSHIMHGTLAYMAPEVYQHGFCSEKSDLYSLGLILYSLFNDKILPFMDFDMEEVAVYKRLAGTPLPDISIESQILQRELNRIIKKACSYIYINRYEGFVEFKEDLCKLLDLVRTNPEMNVEIFAKPSAAGYGKNGKGKAFDADEVAHTAVLPIDEDMIADLEASSSGLDKEESTTDDTFPTGFMGPKPMPILMESEDDSQRPAPVGSSSFPQAPTAPSRPTYSDTSYDSDLFDTVTDFDTDSTAKDPSPSYQGRRTDGIADFDEHGIDSDRGRPSEYAAGSNAPKSYRIRYCAKCGNQLRGGDLFCTCCGAKQTPDWTDYSMEEDSGWPEVPDYSTGSSRPDSPSYSTGPDAGRPSSPSYSTGPSAGRPSGPSYSPGPSAGRPSGPSYSPGSGTGRPSGPGYYTGSSTGEPDYSMGSAGRTDNNADYEQPDVDIRKVEFSAIAPKKMVKGDYSMINIVMYEKTSRHIVDSIIEEMDEPAQERRSGVHKVKVDSQIKVILTSPDIEIEDNEETGIWQGDHLDFSFAVMLPEDYKKRQILFTASVYINDVIACKLKFIVKISSLFQKKIAVTREDIYSAFVSYASQDRNRVASVIQGMKKARPDMDIFFDVEKLRSGQDWETTLYQEIENRDIFYLCWSHFARNSKWVETEWRYALEKKGIECIEPVPIEQPEVCPPPKELNQMHFNDQLLYIINAVHSTPDWYNGIEEPIDKNENE